MKKKIKDLTLEEAKKICRKHNICVKCPLQDALCVEEHTSFVDFELEQEIEVEDNE